MHFAKKYSNKHTIKNKKDLFSLPQIEVKETSPCFYVI